MVSYFAGAILTTFEFSLLFTKVFGVFDLRTTAPSASVAASIFRSGYRWPRRAKRQGRSSGRGIRLNGLNGHLPWVLLSVVAEHGKCCSLPAATEPGLQACNRSDGMTPTPPLGKGKSPPKQAARFTFHALV